MPNKERLYLREFNRQAKASLNFFEHKDGDTFGGHRKPYDGYIVFNGLHLAYEAKWENEELEGHQKQALTDVVIKGKGLSFVARFEFNGKHNRDIHFRYWGFGFEHNESYVLKWSRGKYVDIENLGKNLIKLKKI